MSPSCPKYLKLESLKLQRLYPCSDLTSVESLKPTATPTLRLPLQGLIPTIDRKMVGLDYLNDDVVLYLLGFILQACESDHPGRVALVPLSSTCRWLRRLSKPIMFRSVHFIVGIAPPTPDFYFPPSLWSYIQ